MIRLCSLGSAVLQHDVCHTVPLLLQTLSPLCDAGNILLDGQKEQQNMNLGCLLLNILKHPTMCMCCKIWYFVNTTQML